MNCYWLQQVIDRNLKMQRKEKDHSLALYDLVYQQITTYSPYPYLNQILTFTQYSLFLVQFYHLIEPDILDTTLPYNTIFLVCAALVASFFLLTLLSYNFQILPTVWVYLLLLIEAVQVVYIELTMECFTGKQWCNSDPKMQISTIAVCILLVLIVVLRSYCYCPLYETSNPLSMKTGRTVIYTLLYSAMIVVSTNQITANSSSATKQLTFLATVIFVALTKEPATCSPFISRMMFVLGATIAWTSGLIWIMPLIEQLIGSSSGSIWYFWGFSMPVVLGLTYLHSEKFRRGYQWQALFFENQSQQLQELFLRVNETIKVVENIRKSQLKTNSSEFRMLWGLIQNHNQKCTQPECPLLFVKNMRVERQDELIEQKRFSKTLDKTLQYCLQQLSNQHDNFPNLIQLRLQIANFELEVFHLRTKGLQLFNRQFGKGSSSQKNWGIYFLKKKVQGFEGSGQAGIGQKEEEIAAFKHGIEVSVTMLAEFWYFLSDPKCNIKKLYDLTNVLFPLKIGVDEAWQTVKKLKNIECYHLYARYLIRMFNDKQKGLKILEEARRIELAAHERQEVLAGSEGHASEEHGVIFLQFDGKNSGIMYQVNTACEKMFGYNKGELQGRKVNEIMPRLISKYHDRILENYQQTNRPKMMNKDRQIWGRAKDGYLFPFTICIKPVRNYFSQTSQVYASLKRDLWLKERAFFFTDSEHHLTDLSASMISLFPDIANRIHLKKKIHLSEIVPDYQSVMPRLVEQKETYELSVNRSFKISATETHTEKVTFGMQAQEVSIGVAGSIGYYVRLAKGIHISQHMSQPQEEGQERETMNVNQLEENEKEVRKNFQFVGTAADLGQRMVFQGGISKDSALFRTMMLSRISNDLEHEREANRKDAEGEERVDFGKDIRTKRLQGNVIREILELSQDSELNGATGPDNQEDEISVSDIVKPSELNSILDRQAGNKPIFILKLLTVILLGLSTLLSILQYASLFSNKTSISDSLSTYASLNSLHSQVMFLNLFSTRYSLNGTTSSDLSNFAADVNLLDGLTSALPLSVQSKLMYSDGSSQNMLLAFAINKLISEAQAISSGVSSQAQLFFTQFNGVNGLEVGCEEAEAMLARDINSKVGKSLKECIIYLIISCCIFTLIFLVKNIVLRRVLQKKAQILNVFFEIPRYSCSSIQKECERFIQRLSADGDEFDVDALQGEEEVEEGASKRHSQQKKRTIMGEEKTSTNFVVVSLLMLALLMVYPLMGLYFEHSSAPASKFAVQTMVSTVSVEKEITKTMSFMNTHITQPSYPLAEQSDPIQQINAQYDKIFLMLGTVTSTFFTFGELMDDQYLVEYNRLFFDNLCSNSSCQTALGEDKGLNNILYNYFDYIVAKYQEIIASGGTYNLTVLYPQAKQVQEDSFRLLIKNYWRQMEDVGVQGTKRLLLKGDGVLFGVMLCVCVLNCSVLLWAWMSFYSSLEMKIVATEYILTFIPIDEINKNSKIVKYIKEQVLRLH